MKQMFEGIQPPALVAPAPVDLKRVFRNGWSHQGRVRGWARGTIYGEFADPAARDAWKAALTRATDGMPAGDALDMGTGPGTVSQLWAELGWRTSGLDFSPTMLATCAAAASERGLTISLHQGDVESPQTYLGRKRFDVISSRLVLFTLPHPGRAVRRWVEMLGSGGRLVLIGEDHPDRNRPREQDRPRKEAPPGAWRADEEYKNALSQLDFMHHDSRLLRVVMEAAGLETVTYVPLDAVTAARTVIRESGVEYRVFSSQPFMLVGSKLA